MDLDALAADLDALAAELEAERGIEDLEHLRRMDRWSWLLLALGHATAWIVPNPLSIFALSQGNFMRWAMIAHHVLHKGYDRVEGAPASLTSKGFAKGWRRWLHWLDWMTPEAWSLEHNLLHHYRLGERADPDQPEENTALLRTGGWPKPLRYLALFVMMAVWKWAYYAPNTIKELHNARARRDPGGSMAPASFFEPALWSPLSRPGRELWLRSYLPYFAVHFVLLPSLCLLLGPWFALSMLVNKVLAEILTNVHSFLIIVPNHAGEDVFRFEGRTTSRAQFYLRQIVGSADYRTGGDLNDALHGWLNYQVEHHLWPDMTMLQYRRAQPRVRAICAKHGVPYVQESVWTRFRKLMDMAVGDRAMPVWRAAEP